MNDNPYAAPDHGIDRHPINDRLGADKADYTYLGFWKRVLASIIDNVLLIIAFIPLAIALYATLDGEQAELTYNVVSLVFSITAILLFWRYKQATPGKMVFSARIVDGETFAPPAFGKLVLRYIGYIPSTLVLGLGLLWVAFDKRKRGWHDLMAGTVVIVPRPLSDRRRTRAIPKPTSDMPPADNTPG